MKGITVSAKGELSVQYNFEFIEADVRETSCTIYLPKIVPNTEISQIVFFINDYYENADVNAIILVAPSGQRVNGQQQVTFNKKGISIVVRASGINDFIAVPSIQDIPQPDNNPNFCSVTLHKEVVLGTPVEFTKNNYSDEVDYIDTDVAITRGNSQPIYNPLLEKGWNDLVSPEGTLWNNTSWGDLSNVQDRTYTTFAEALDYAIGDNVVGSELVMFDTINNKYYKFEFIKWTQGGNGGGFSYIRTEINVVCSGRLTFSDGTYMDTIVKDNKNYIVVDDVYGDDATAQAYNMLKPCKTVTKAKELASDGDLIVINPSPNTYINSGNAFFQSVPKALSYYVSKGATMYMGGKIDYTNDKDIRIYGEGNIITTGIQMSSGGTGKFIVDVNKLTILGNITVLGAWKSDIIVNANEIEMRELFYYENSAHWATQTEATNFTINANKVVNNAILFAIFPCNVNMNINVKNYNQKNSVVPSVWNYGGDPTFKVVSYFNFGYAYIDRSMAFSQQFFNFVGGGGTETCSTYITGEYNYIGRGVGGDRGNIITFDGGFNQTVYFNGVANIKNGAMFLDLNSKGKALIGGKVYVDNPDVTSQHFTLSTYFVSSIKSQITADTIINDKFNFGLQMGDYSSTRNTAQVDVNDCQLVNKNIGSLKATVGKGYAAFGGVNPSWGKLRLKNVKIIGAKDAISGASPNEPVEVYSAYLNNPPSNILNSIPSTGGFVVDANITSNDF